MDGARATIDTREYQRRREMRLGLGLVGSFALGLAIHGAVTAWLTGAGLVTIVITTIWLIAWGSWASASNAHRAPERVDAVSVEEGALVTRLGRRRLTTTGADVAASWRDGAGRLSLLRHDGRRITLDVSEDQARAIEQALGCSPRLRRAALSGLTPPAQRGRGCLQSFALIALLGTLVYAPLVHWAVRSGSWPHFAGLAGMALLAAAWSRHHGRRQVTLGRDGLWMPGILRSRFIHLADIASATPRELKLESGETVALAAPVEGLAERLAMLKTLPREDALLSGEALARGERSLAAWKEALADLAGGQDYRRQGWSAEALLAVVEDPSHAPEERVGAAVAATRIADPDVKKRIVVAAESSADPDLEEALTRAAEAEIAEAALARAEARHRRAR